MPTTTAQELGLHLNLCGIFTVASLVEHLRTDPDARATLIDSDYTHALLATTAVVADVETQANIVEPADADAEPVVEVAVAEVMITEAFQIGEERLAREVAARHAAEECYMREVAARQQLRATAVAADAQT